MDPKSLLTRGNTLSCGNCPACVLVEHAGQLPAGWVILKAAAIDGGGVMVLCPACDEKITVKA